MPPSLGDRLAHIIEAIDSIQSILADQTQESLDIDRTRRLALERAFEIVCEASRYVPADVKAQETAIDWRKMNDLGNLLRHAYHLVNISRLVVIAKNDLPPLKAFVERIVAEESRR